MRHRRSIVVVLLGVAMALASAGCSAGLHVDRRDGIALMTGLDHEGMDDALILGTLGAQLTGGGGEVPALGDQDPPQECKADRCYQLWSLQL